MKDLSGITAVVTGAAGFAGKFLIAELRSRGASTVGIVYHDGSSGADRAVILIMEM
jgi:nucleoside-diphosphate-sugar epimerase